MSEVIELRKFSQIDLNDTFFDSLKEDYPGFEDWFVRKSEESVYVQYSSTNELQAFLYIKNNFENHPENVEPELGEAKWMKVGTFKIKGHNTRLGERFVKIITDQAIYRAADCIYLTIFPKHENLLSLLNRYGFADKGTKGDEKVLVKDMRVLTGNMLKDYPLIDMNNTDKYVLSVYPKYHTRLFPDSILRSEENVRDELIRDVSFTNSIHKIYISFIQDTAKLKQGDLVAIYRTNDGLGYARYRSVISSICSVEEVKTKNSFNNIEEFLEYTKTYSVFSEEELKKWYLNPNIVVIKMIYNIALNKRVTRGFLIDNVNIPQEIYWGFFKLNDSQFKAILEKGEVDENIIINKA